MADRNTTKRMFTHMINMMEQHDTMTISCGDPLMELLKDVRELLKEQEAVVRCKDCKNACVYDDDEVVCTHIDSNGNDKHPADWFCADGERRTDDA